MAKSDPRRATIIGIVGIVVGTVLILAVLLAGNLGGSDDTHTTSSKSTFDVGPAGDRAAAITRDQTPLLFQDPVQFEHPIFVHHLGSDAKTGWTAFDAVVGKDCVLTWHRESQDFTDCHDARVPADGGGQHHYPTTVDKDGHVIVDLSVDAATSTSSP